MSARKDLNRLMYENGICEKQEISKGTSKDVYYSNDDDAVPDDVLFYNNDENILALARIKKTNLNEAETTYLILLKILDELKNGRVIKSVNTIKTCTVFFCNSSWDFPFLIFLLFYCVCFS